MKLLILIACLNVLTACGSSSSQRESSADHYCRQQGGTLSYEKRLFGKTGYCILPDGTRVERWRLYLRDRVLPSNTDYQSIDN